MFTLLCAISIQILKFFCKDRRLLLYMSRTLHLFGTDWCAMMVPIQVIRWYRMQCYDGTDSCATVVPIRRYCQHRAYYFTTALLAVSIFCFFLHVNINNSNIISRIGRVNSIHIYIVHWVLIEILFRIGNDVSPYLYFLSPLIIFFVSYVLSETYLKILVNRFPTKCKK